MAPEQFTSYIIAGLPSSGASASLTFLLIFVLSTLYIFFYQLSFDISVDSSFYSSDDKLWAHRVLNPSDAKSLSKEFNGVEIDVFFNSKFFEDDILSHILT